MDYPNLAGKARKLFEIVSPSSTCIISEFDAVQREEIHLSRECQKSNNSRPPLVFDGCLVQQHDRDVVLDQIHPAALPALQAFRVLPVLEGQLARGTDQNIQQIFGNHDKGIVLKMNAHGGIRT